MVAIIFPFNTSMGLNPDNIKAGYSPEKNTPVRNKPVRPNQKFALLNNEKLRSCPESLLNPGMATITITNASTMAKALSKADSDKN